MAITTFKRYEMKFMLDQAQLDIKHSGAVPIWLSRTLSGLRLKIVVPENLNYQGLFDDFLNQSTDSWAMNRVKTKDFGTLFEVVYNINLKQAINQKTFLDELRCRNGNLNIA